MTEIRPIAAVCFDLDETLCQYDIPPEVVLQRAFDRVGIDPFFDVEAYRAVFDEVVDLVDDMAELRRRCFERLADRSGKAPSTGRAVAEAYTELRSPDRVSFLPGARELVDHCTERYKTAIVTNGVDQAQATKVEVLGLAEAVDTVVYAGVDTPAKPDPAPFELALSRLGVPAERTMFIGNSLEHDIAGATAVGMHTVWIRDESPADPSLETNPTIEATSPAELLPPPWEAD